LFPPDGTNLLRLYQTTLVYAAEVKRSSALQLPWGSEGVLWVLWWVWCRTTPISAWDFRLQNRGYLKSYCL